MTEQETIRIVTLVVMSYPAVDRFRDENIIKGMVAIWTSMFQDDDVHLVELAVKTHVALNKWPPSIAEIREHMAKFSSPDIIPPDVAWEGVNNLLLSESEFSNPDIHTLLPNIVAETVEIIGYSKLYSMFRGKHTGNHENAAKTAFMEQYQPRYKRVLEEAMLPKSIVDVKKNALNGSEAMRKIEQLALRRQEKESFFEQLAFKNKFLGVGSNE